MMLSPFKGFAKTLPALLFAAGLGLTSCAEVRTVDTNYEDMTVSADRALTDISPKNPVAQSLTIDSNPYYGSAAVPITNGSALPPQFETQNAIVMTFARPVTMEELMRMVQAVTGLRAAATGTSLSAATTTTEKTFMPTDGEQVAGGRVVWSGRLSDLLNQAADYFNADWHYDGTSIDFAQQITRTFMLHALASELSYKGTVKSGSSGDSASNLPEVDVTSSASLKVWDEIKDAVSTIMGDAGKAAFSPSTGTITVTGEPDIVRRVEAYLNQQNSMRLRRVAIAVKVISVTANNDLDLSADVTGIVRRAFGMTSVRSIGGATSGLALGVIRAPQDTAVATQVSTDRLLAEFKANSNVTRASVAHSGAIVTLSDQPAPLQVGRQISYLKRTSSTSGDTGGSVSLEPGTVNTGLMMTILPRIVEGNKILMRLSVAITDAQQPFATFTSGSGDSAASIQLPEVETTGFLQNAVVTSGETLVLAGFEKKLNSKTDQGTPYLPILGGSKNTNRDREVTVMLITSEILPEDPITVIGNQ